jgi:hypothetical protein
MKSTPMMNFFSALRRKFSFTSLQWALFIGLAILGITGVALIVAAPFDGSARTQLGSSLLTGVVVGIAVVGFESSLDTRKAGREEETRRKIHQEMIDSANDRLASFATNYIEALSFLFLQGLSNGASAPEQPIESGPESAERGLTPREQPPGWRWPDDAQKVTRALIWRAEFMRDHSDWWHDNLELARTDAIYDVGYDLARMFGWPLDYRDSYFAEERDRTIDRLSGVAQRLSESGNAAAAARLDEQVEYLRFRNMVSYMPELPLSLNQDDDEIVVIGEGGSGPLRRELLWLTAELREHKIVVDRDGDPVQGESESAEQYRWGPLFSSSDNIITAWDDRFRNNSWFRRLMDLAPSELSRTKLGRLAQGSHDSN